MTKLLNKIAEYCSEQPEAQMPFIQHNVNTDASEEPDDMPIYNVLLIGQSQSGKSTLLEAIKQYADTTYKADRSRIGTGNVSLTSEPRIEEVVTCLPAYRIYETNHHGRQEIDVEHHFEGKMLGAFKTLLSRQEGLELTAERTIPFSRFRIIDTPGLDDSQGRDIENLGRIFSTLSSLGQLHLVIITDSHDTVLAPGYQAALRTIISGIMGRRFPSFKIDCNLQEKRPFHICLTRNIIRDILSTATIKTPVALTMQVQKTPPMRAVDQTVYAIYAGYFSNLEKACATLDSADRLRLEIIQTEAKIATKEEDLQAIDTNELLHLYEVRFDQDWEHFYIIKRTLLQYSTFDYSIGASNLKYPAVEILTEHREDEKEADRDDETEADEELVETMEEQGEEEDGSMIDDVRVMHSGVDILEDSEVKVSEAKGKKCWRVLFQRKSYQKGYYHAILSIKSCNKHRKDIDNLKREIHELKVELEKLRRDRTRRLTELELQGIDITTAVDPKAYESLHRRLSIFGKMMKATKGKFLGLEVFVELALSGVYHGGSINASSEALERFWAAKLGFDPNNHST
ncbi:hypothetical protein EC957_005112 [Mortierella hygrophila]|uniref:G domain-containing protein n=1 Tax=Mortierella hygrophila TaxID=979708 RepID=A0A9P6EZU4_9FUNG|nr:hypothetical protein EC957_005112 [Mortierella hygrophila]